MIATVNSTDVPFSPIPTVWIERGAIDSNVSTRCRRGTPSEQSTSTMSSPRAHGVEPEIMRSTTSSSSRLVLPCRCEPSRVSGEKLDALCADGSLGGRAHRLAREIAVSRRSEIESTFPKLLRYMTALQPGAHRSRPC
jgi:hypothetical protein